MSQRLDVQKQRQWEQRFERYRSGGLTVARFCAKERVSPNTFYYWARRVGSQPVRPGSSQADQTPDEMPNRARLAAAMDLAAPSNAGVVRFRLNTAVEVLVPASCLDVIRCLTHCLQRSSPDHHSAAFQEVLVGPRARATTEPIDGVNCLMRKPDLPKNSGGHGCPVLTQCAAPP